VVGLKVVMAPATVNYAEPESRRKPIGRRRAAAQPLVGAAFDFKGCHQPFRNRKS
jgi:hypothetical protein